MRRAAVFDAMGTLFDLEPLRGRLGDAGAPPAALEAWFEQILHSGATPTLLGGHPHQRRRLDAGAAAPRRPRSRRPLGS